MQNVSLFVVIYLTIWIQDDCTTIEAAKPKHPFTVAREAIRNVDKSPSYLHIVDFGPQGTGVVAGKDFSPGDFITYYHGKHSSEKPDLDDHEYEFLFKLNHYHKSFWIDASEEDGSYGRLLNDDWKNPTARARVIFVDGQAHVVFLARRSIKTGEEIRYNFRHGATDFPWRQPKKHPFAEAREAIRNADASPSYLHIEYFGTHKGRGIVAGKDFSHGDFITYYHGKHSPEKPDLTDEEHDYLFKLNHYFKSFWIDASEEDGSYGRLLNDDWKNPTARARVIFVDGQAHVAFLARRSIQTGEEIRFNYNHGATHFPWRQMKQAVTKDGESSRSSDESSLDLQEQVPDHIFHKENLCPWQLQLIAAKAAIRRSDMSPDHLRIVDLGYPKGRGMVANTNIGRGEYVTYYYGMRDVMEPDVEDNSYTFQIAYRNTRFWVDGSEEDGSYGRLINDEWRHPNLRSGMIFVDGVPHVSFFALRQILEGEEIHFNYGGSEDLLPWRTQENRSYFPV